MKIKLMTSPMYQLDPKCQNVVFMGYAISFNNEIDCRGQNGN